MVESLERGGLYRTRRSAHLHGNDPRTLLALRIDGAPLALDHGFPVRLISPQPAGRAADQVGHPGASGMSGPYASDPARPLASAAGPWWRWLFLVPGFAAVGWGALRPAP